MYPDWFVFAFLAVAIFLWLGVLTYFLISGRQSLNSLFPKSGERDIRKKFEEITAFVDQFNEEVEGIKVSLKKLEKQSALFTQKVHLLRFNPYNDTGGDQSFSIAFLDREGNGIVVTSLHTRSGTRVYAKPVILGRPGKYQFSKEEEQTIKKALV